MSSPDTVPDLEWYQKKSKAIGGAPRCPFAALRRCPKYYSSVWVMGEHGGAAKIPESTDKELLKYWEQIDLWPIPGELEPAAVGPPNDAHIFWNICPEVSYDRFGHFASHLYQYADEIDLDCAHKALSASHAGSNDWRWTWSGLTPQHYSECPMYSQLLAGVKEVSGSVAPTKGRIGF